MKSEIFDVAASEGKDIIVDRQTYVRYFEYLSYLTPQRESKIKSGDGLFYKGIKIICA